MKRSEFLKRLGLGLGAAVAAPALLKGEEKAIEYHKAECADSVGETNSLAFWRQSSTDAISAEPTFLSTGMATYLEDFKKQEPVKFKATFLYED